MNTEVRKTSDRLHGILYYCQNLPTPLAADTMGSNFAPQVQALNDAVTRLTTYMSAAISGSSSSAVEKRRALRRALRVDHIDPIRRVARAVEKTHPEVSSLVQVPHYDAGTDTQLSAATAIAKDLVPYHDLFVADGLPADFLDQLNTAIQALSQSVEARRAEQQQQAVTQQAIKTAISDGRQAARHLDALVRSAIKAANDPVHDPLALAGWERAYRVPSSGTASGASATAATHASAGASAGTATGAATSVATGTSAGAPANASTGVSASPSTPASTSPTSATPAAVSTAATPTAPAAS